MEKDIMETTSNAEATLSLLESISQISALSGNTNQLEKECFERLRNRVRILESENVDLKRLQPRLIDAQGKDCTTEFAKLSKDLQLAKDSYAILEAEHLDLRKTYTDFEQYAMGQINQRDEDCKRIKRQAIELEEECSKLREQIQDEQSKLFHVQAGQRLNQTSLNELHLRDQIQSSLSKFCGNEAHLSAFAQLNDSFGDLSANDADAIAAHLYLIIEKLDRNHQDAEELQNAIFSFLAEYGFSGDQQKFATFANIYKDLVDKRQKEIRAMNDDLRTKLHNVTTDKEFEACVQHLNQDSISLSTTFPSAAAAALVAFQEGSIVGTAEHNLTMESIAAVNLANRTSNLAEACIRMFEKLRGTAEFFQAILNKIGVSDDEFGGDIMHKIESLKLDLDKSLGEARSIVDEAKNAQRNLRSIIFEQSQLALNSTAQSVSVFLNESKLADGVISSTAAEMQLNACQKCQEMEGLYESTKQTLNNELTNKEVLIEQIANAEERIETYKKESEELVNIIKELESQVCEKCLELTDLYTNAKTALDSEHSRSEELRQKLMEYEEGSKHLKEQLEMASSTKENMIPRDVLIGGMREELNKIYDTMQFATSRMTGTSTLSSVGHKNAKKEKKGSSGSGSKAN